MTKTTIKNKVNTETKVNNTQTQTKANNTQAETKQKKAETKQEQTETKQKQAETKQEQTETKQKQAETKQEQAEVLLPQTEEEQKKYDEIGANFDKMIDGMKSIGARFIDSDSEIYGDFNEIIEELEADKLEMQEGVIVGSEQWQEDVFMHQVSLGAGVVMAGVGGVLLFKARKVIGNTKAKIAGWILAGLGVGIVGLHIVQLIA